MEDIIDVIINFFFQTIGFEKSSVKNLFDQSGLSWLWVLLRDYVFNYKVWLLGLVPALILEWFMPAIKRKNILNVHLVMDAVYPLMNALVAVLVAGAIGAFIIEFYKTNLPFLNTGLLDNKPLWIQVIGAFLITDLMFYISHRMLHEVRWFWYFHTIHHSQTYLNPMTTNRGHPVQGIINLIVRTIPIAFVGGETSTWIVYLILNNFWGYFIHSNVRINMRIIKYFLVTPQYHRVHHSIEEKHFDKNYGERLIIWDVIFGTAYTNYDDHHPETGVPDTEWIMEAKARPFSLINAWICQMIYPFIMIKKSINNHMRYGKKKDRI